MLTERPPLTPLQIILSLWIVAVVLYGMTRLIDLPYHTRLRPTAQRLAESFKNARTSAVLKATEQSVGKVTLHFRPLHGPYTQIAVDDEVLKLPEGVYLVDTFGAVPPGDDLVLDQFGEYGSPEPITLTVVATGTPAVARLRLRSGKPPTWQ